MNWIKLSFFHALIFVMFYYYFLSPIRIELSHKLLTEKQLKQELLKKRKYVNKNKPHHKAHITYLTKEALIKYFFNKVAASKFLIEEIIPTKIQMHGKLIKISFKVTLLGNIFQCKNLIDQLSEDQFLINIDEVVVKKSSNNIVMKIDVFNISDIETKHFYVLQWIGYTENNKTIKGLLRLENGGVLEVAVGSVINKSLKILKITKDQMLVQVGNHKSMIKYGQWLELVIPVPDKSIRAQE